MRGSLSIPDSDAAACILPRAMKVTMVKAGVSYCAGPNKDVWYNRVVDRIKRRETQVLLLVYCCR